MMSPKVNKPTRKRTKTAPREETCLLRKKKEIEEKGIKEVGVTMKKIAIEDLPKKIIWNVKVPRREEGITMKKSVEEECMKEEIGRTMKKKKKEVEREEVCLVSWMDVTVINLGGRMRVSQRREVNLRVKSQTACSLSAERGGGYM